jgi:hypothetical protein
MSIGDVVSKFTEQERHVEKCPRKSGDQLGSVLGESPDVAE